MYQGDQRVGHSGPETLVAGSRQGVLVDTPGGWAKGGS